MYNSKAFNWQGVKFYFKHLRVTLVLFIVLVVVFFLVNLLSLAFLRTSIIITVLGIIVIYSFSQTLYDLFLIHYIKRVETGKMASVLFTIGDIFNKNLWKDIFIISSRNIYYFLLLLFRDRKRYRNQSTISMRDMPVTGSFRTETIQKEKEMSVYIPDYWKHRFKMCYSVLFFVPIESSSTKTMCKDLIARNKRVLAECMQNRSKLAFFLPFPFILLFFAGLLNTPNTPPETLSVLPGLIVAVAVLSYSFDTMYSMMIVIWNEKWRRSVEELDPDYNRIPILDEIEPPSLFNDKLDLPWEDLQ